ncbi:MAG: hypothetical protein GF411_15160 [Candidatus Lokiarchaeota archaeon]|nr:hypothetical protein [Candidatus Lokiarchaeota archaeon]
MPWHIDNYYIHSGAVLCVEITIPLIDFLITEIDDVKNAWFTMLQAFVDQNPGFELSWEMEPRDDDALVIVRVAKAGELKKFTDLEKKAALSAADALFDE